jgi:hypothetical protein
MGLGLAARSSWKNGPRHDDVVRASGALAARSPRDITVARSPVAAVRWQGVADEHQGSFEKTPGMVTRNDADRKGVTADEVARWREAAALSDGEGAPVVAGGARGVLQDWGTTGSEEGWSMDDGELRRVELTERGRSGDGSSEFVADGGAPMVGPGREANGDVGGVARG